MKVLINREEATKVINSALPFLNCTGNNKWRELYLSKMVMTKRCDPEEPKEMCDSCKLAYALAGLQITTEFL